MKRNLFLLLFLVSASYTIAQLPDNSIAPDFTATDLNGNTHNLYAYLDSGYTVVLDLSATWCSPCWAVHQTGLLQNIYDTYGPNGTNEMRVFYIESESQNSTAQLYGTGTSGGGANPATDTQGDWVTGHTFPFIDDASIANAYQLSAFPTLYAICPERLTRVFVGSPAPSLTEFHDIAVACNGVATELNDPSMLLYTGDELALCSTFDASLQVQNLGTNNLTTLTIELQQNGVAIATNTWTGNAATYQVITVNFGSVSYTEGVSIDAVITDVDDNVNNNDLTFSIANPNTSVVDVMEGMEDGTFNDLPSKLNYVVADFDLFTLSKNDFNTPPANEIGGFGNSTKSLIFDFYEFDNGTASVVLDKVTLPSLLDSAELTFSYTYTNYSGTENDQFKVEISDDCGATWTSLFDKQGTSLATISALNSFYVPSPSDWVKETFDLSAYAGETVIVRLSGTSDYGNNLYLDDINLTFKATVGINEISSLSNIQLYPNPTNNIINLKAEFDKVESNIKVKIISVDGKLMDEFMFENSNLINSTFKVNDYNKGVYFIELTTNNGSSLNKFIVK